MPLIAQDQVDVVVSGFIREEIESAFYGFYAATAVMAVTLLMYVLLFNTSLVLIEESLATKASGTPTRGLL
ncbi:hypothetical protein BDZ89DRAFT_1142294 [Hymenopellis radicata]|nr:hypothetical protein BDZ89DRAFT_1142294 [Hymenopellis radicata]